MSLHPGDHETRPADDRCMQVLADLCGGIFTRSRRQRRATQHTEQASQLNCLIEAGARVDAALALIAMELPQWRLRCLVYDGGEWHCTLSSHREMPEWLDPSIETHHPNMAAAILEALHEVIRADAASHLTTAPSQAMTCETVEPIPCENYI